MAIEDANAKHSSVHALFQEYVARTEIGDTPDAADYERRLGTDAQRREFQQLVRTYGALDEQLPPWLGPGTVLSDRYRLDRPLGNGGMASVWLARDQKNDRDVALKLLRVAMPRERVSALLRQERKALTRLHHPHIVNFLDADQWRDTFYLVMEVIDGRSMKEVIETLRQQATDDPAWRRSTRALRTSIGKQLPGGRQDLLDRRSHEAGAAAIVAAAASALECAHSVGVVHRDLKPLNILLVGGGNPVLIDFGLASLRDASRGPLSTALFGTPAYIAPEQARAGKMGSDVRSDVYQLGLTLFELVTLSHPWAGEAADEVLAAIARKKVPRARDADPAVSHEIDSICYRATATDPDQRYQSATELRVDLERFLGGRILPEAASTSAPLVLRARYFVRRRGVLLLVVALALIAIVMACGRLG